VTGEAKAPGHRRIKVRQVAVAVAVVVLVMAACGYAWAAKQVTVIVDGVEIPCFSLRMTVNGVLGDAGVALHPRDVVDPGPAERVKDGAVIAVRRAVPLVIRADGQTLETLSAQLEPRDVLVEAGIELGPDDRVEFLGGLAAGAPLAGDSIRVVRVRKEYESRMWRIPRRVQRIEDDSLSLGITRVLQKGQDGTEEVIFCAVFEDGKQVSNKIVERRVVAEPVPETVLVGTSGEVSRGGEIVRFRKAMVMTATAYYWGPESTGKWADGYTYTGLKATRGVIAVDPKVIPLGTRVYVDGYGFAIAGDIGSAIKGNKIDLCYDTLAEALQWGRRTVNLYIL
jgi:uncharacterized protein YabE (DUF348 family)